MLEDCLLCAFDRRQLRPFDIHLKKGKRFVEHIIQTFDSNLKIPVTNNARTRTEGIESQNLWLVG